MHDYNLLFTFALIMITEITKQVLWRKFKEANYSLEFLAYVKTVCIEFGSELEESFWINMIKGFKENEEQNKDKIFWVSPDSIEAKIMGIYKEK